MNQISDAAIQKKSKSKKILYIFQNLFPFIIQYMNSLPKKKQRSIPSFLKKTYQILQDSENQKIVRWANDGKGFRVLDQEGFSKLILPKYFKHSNYSSFVRQLNMYNFHKMRDCTTQSFFYHEFFDKNDNQAIYQIKRKPQRKKKKDDEQNEEVRGEISEEPFKTKSLKKRIKVAFNQIESNTFSETSKIQNYPASFTKIKSSTKQPCSYYSKINDRQYMPQNEEQDNISIQNCIKQKIQRLPHLLGTKELICPSTTNFYTSIYNNSTSLYSIGSLIR